MEKRIESLAAHYSESIFALSDAIWQFSEVRFETPHSADAMTALLYDEGFNITRPLATLDHAFMAHFGSEGPIIGFLAEYDALGEANHGCGHNLLGSGSCLAALICKAMMEELELKYQVRVYGCPAEESGYGKGIMNEQGVFDDLAICLTWHPNTFTQVWADKTLAVQQVQFDFQGIASHAAGAPEQGRSALDAAELMNIGVNYLREHVSDDVRIHYAYLNAGGPSANVVPDQASLYYFIRAKSLHDVDAVVERVKKIAYGAAQMTETNVLIKSDGRCKSYNANHILSKQLHQAILDLGPILSTNKHYDQTIKNPVFNQTGFVSTDVGDVSWTVPTAQIFIACEPIGFPMHAREWHDQGRSSYAHQGIVKAGSVLALAGLRTLLNPDEMAAVQSEFKAQLALSDRL